MAETVDLADNLLTTGTQSRGSALVEVTLIPSGDPPVPTTQRIFDSNLAVWCWYELVAITATPNVGDTTPNHTNTLVAATHEVMG